MRSVNIGNPNKKRCYSRLTDICLIVSMVTLFMKKCYFKYMYSHSFMLCCLVWFQLLVFIQVHCKTLCLNEKKRKTTVNIPIPNSVGIYESNLNLHFIEILITSSIKIEAKTLWVSSKYPIIPIKRLHLFFSIGQYVALDNDKMNHTVIGRWLIWQPWKNSL